MVVGIRNLLQLDKKEAIRYLRSMRIKENMKNIGTKSGTGSSKASE